MGLSSSAIHPWRRLSGVVAPGLSSSAPSGLTRASLFCIEGALLLIVLGMRAAIGGKSGPLFESIGYACFALPLLAAAGASYLQATLADSRMRFRWQLLASAWLLMGICYTVASLQHGLLIPDTFAQFALPLLANLGAGFFLIAGTLFFSGSSRSIAVLDFVQAAVFISLRFGATFASHPFSANAPDRALMVQLLTVFAFLLACLAPMGAISRQERLFLRVIALYFGTRVFERFLGGEMGYHWKHVPLGDFSDLPTILIELGFALLLIEMVWRTSRSAEPDAEIVRPRLLVRSVMPSLLALATLSLAMYAFLHQHGLGFAAVLCCIACYVGRTLLLQAQTTKEADNLRSHNEQLQALSQRDPLTGTGNRRSLAATYARWSSHAGTAKDFRLAAPQLTLLLVDIDFFKQANDQLGHLHGDRVLISVAGVLQAAIASVPDSHCARFGGDEFALLLRNVTPQQTSSLAESMRAAVAALALPAGPRTLTVSIGSAAVPLESATSLETLTQQADAALYRAKLNGRNRSEFDGTALHATPDMRVLQNSIFGEAEADRSVAAL